MDRINCNMCECITLGCKLPGKAVITWYHPRRPSTRRIQYGVMYELLRTKQALYFWGWVNPMDRREV